MQGFIFDTQAFNNKYKGTRKFSETSQYYTLFMRSLSDDKLYEHIVFCNDVLKLPPVYVFVKYYNLSNLSDSEKRGLGACFGFLFRFSGFYTYKDAVSVWVGDEQTGIKNASYFI